MVRRLLPVQSVFEPCGVPGGVQVTLIPWAVLGLIFYTGGYPAFVMQARSRAVGRGGEG